MTALLQFGPLTEGDAGLLYHLLRVSYASLLAADARCWGGEEARFLAFDREVSSDRNVRACVFVSRLDDRPVGFASWDPRAGPGSWRVGHHCIVPEQRGQGYGRQQLGELVRRAAEGGCRALVATTSEHPFFLPARATYEASGFRMSGHRLGGPDPRYGLIDYVLEVPVPPSCPPA